ncbi:hypothetical protein B9Z55_015546 [Caenorhabditis nigoni]|uniref:Uncharacterized protein n=1 Tax=Caenorhabditis nigoni TaxID=1611254 RepID=A0A2G5UBA4_9PELO|nr:hypothetical protein B9Z55_015546 [Caenorhabditis nigoni]
MKSLKVQFLRDEKRLREKTTIRPADGHYNHLVCGPPLTIQSITTKSTTRPEEISCPEITNIVILAFIFGTIIGFGIFWIVQKFLKCLNNVKTEVTDFQEFKKSKNELVKVDAAEVLNEEISLL